MIAMYLLDRMNKKLIESFSEPWGTRGTLRSHIHELSEDQATGAISGKINISVLTQSGQQAIAFTHVFDDLQSEDDVDACLAEALSRLLEVHSSWPR